MSSGSTETLGLHLWEKTDLFQMDEFNEDNQLLDSALAARPWVLLTEQSLSDEAETITVDLSGFDLTAYGRLHLHLDAAFSSAGVYPLSLLLNETGGAGLYYTMDAAGGESAFSLSDGDGLPLGSLAGNGLISGMEITIDLYSTGLLVESRGIAVYGESAPVLSHCFGLASSELAVTPDTLESLRLYCGDTALAAGSKAVVYGQLLS